MNSDVLILIPARMASTRLPGKPLADIGGVPMIVRVMRRAQAAAARAGRGRDRFAGNRRRRDASRRPRRDDAGRPRLRLGPHLRGAAASPIRRAAPDRRQRAGRPADARSRRHPPRRSARSPIRPSTSRRSRWRSPRTPSAPIPNVVKAVGSPVAPGRLRALYFTRATAPAGEGPLYHHIGLYAYRRAALARFVALPPSPLEQRERLEQLRALEAGMRIDVALIDKRPSGSTRRSDLDKARARCSRVDLRSNRHCVTDRVMNKLKDRVPGRARRQFRHRGARGLSGLRAAALRDLRGRASRRSAAATPISA